MNIYAVRQLVSIGVITAVITSFIVMCKDLHCSYIFLNVRALILLSLAVTHYHSSDLLSNLHIIPMHTHAQV